MSGILDRIFPPQFDRRFRGNRPALWLLYFILFLNIGISLTAIFRADGGAQSADGIPLNTFGHAAAAAVVGVVAYLGLSDLLLNLVFALAALRYRSMVPLTYLLLLLRFFGHKGINWMKPIERVGGGSGSVVSLTIFGLTVLGFVLSMRGRAYRGGKDGMTDSANKV